MQGANPVISSLTGLRWWAAFAVFLFHMTVFAPLPVYPAFEYGYYGVMFFFVLSGFVLSWSWKPSVSVRTFYLRRIGRIWPSSLVALFIAIPVFYSLNPNPDDWWVKPFDVGVLLLSFILVQGWWLAPTILFSGNPAAWTLTCEFFFYSLHPLFQRILVRSSKFAVLLFLVALLVGVVSIKALCLINLGQGCVELPLPIARLHEFVLGMGIGILARKGFLLSLSPWVPISLLGLLFSCLVFAGTVSNLEGPFAALVGFSNEVTLVLIVLTIGGVANRELSGHRTGFQGKWLVRMGELSFNFYLVHATVMYMFVNTIGELDVAWGNIIWYPIVLAGGVLVALGLHELVEKPFEVRIRKLADKISAKNS
jgi:peptidoglycan/LPS O-acetylase OafA/YrhL